MSNHRHRFSDIDGKCDFCNILGCKYRLTLWARPGRGPPKISFHILMAPARGELKCLIDHRFSDIDGKCEYCFILGCKNGFINHRFSDIDGTCEYCYILGCKNGFINHRFSDIDGTCDFCFAPRYGIYY